MKDRLRKEEEQRRRAAIHEILDLVMDINGLQESERDITGNHPTAFLYFHGHVGEIEANVIADGWEPDAGYDAMYTSPIYAGGMPYKGCTLDKTIQGLKTLKKDLSGGNRKEVQLTKTNTSPLYMG